MKLAYKSLAWFVYIAVSVFWFFYEMPFQRKPIHYKGNHFIRVVCISHFRTFKDIADTQRWHFADLFMISNWIASCGVVYFTVRNGWSLFRFVALQDVEKSSHKIVKYPILDLLLRDSECQCFFCECGKEWRFISKRIPNSVTWLPSSHRSLRS